jgi:hypothetical protein
VELSGVTSAPMCWSKRFMVKMSRTRGDWELNGLSGQQRCRHRRSAAFWRR